MDRNRHQEEFELRYRFSGFLRPLFATGPQRRLRVQVQENFKKVVIIYVFKMY